MEVTLVLCVLKMFYSFYNPRFLLSLILCSDEERFYGGNFGFVCVLKMFYSFYNFGFVCVLKMFYSFYN